MTGEASPWDGRPALPKRLSDERFDARYEFAHLKFQKWTKRTSPRGGRPPVLGLVAQIPVLGMVARYTYASNTHYTCRPPVLGMAAQNASSWDGRPYVRSTHTLYLSRLHDVQSQFSGWPPVRTREQHVLGRDVDHHLVGRLGRFLMLYVKTTEKSLSLCTEERQLSI